MTETYFSLVSQHPRSRGRLLGLEFPELGFLDVVLAYLGAAATAATAPAGMGFPDLWFVAAFFIHPMGPAQAGIHEGEAGGEDHALRCLFTGGASAWVVPFRDGAQLAEVAAVAAGEIIDWHDRVISLLRDPLRYLP